MPELYSTVDSVLVCTVVNLGFISGIPFGPPAHPGVIPEFRASLASTFVPPSILPTLPLPPLYFSFSFLVQPLLILLLHLLLLFLLLCFSSSSYTSFSFSSTFLLSFLSSSFSFSIFPSSPVYSLLLFPLFPLSFPSASPTFPSPPPPFLFFLLHCLFLLSFIFFYISPPSSHSLSFPPTSFIQERGKEEKNLKQSITGCDTKIKDQNQSKFYLFLYTNHELAERKKC